MFWKLVSLLESSKLDPFTFAISDASLCFQSKRFAPVLYWGHLFLAFHNWYMTFHYWYIAFHNGYMALQNWYTAFQNWYRPLITDNFFLITGTWSFITGIWRFITCTWPFITGTWPFITDIRPFITGTWPFRIWRPIRTKIYPSIWNAYTNRMLKFQAFATNSCWEKCDRIFCYRHR